MYGCVYTNDIDRPFLAEFSSRALRHSRVDPLHLYIPRPPGPSQLKSPKTLTDNCPAQFSQIVKFFLFENIFRYSLADKGSVLSFAIGPRIS